MGRETKNFRQTTKGNRSSAASSNYAKINRSGSWGRRLNYGTSKKRSNIS